MVLYYPFGSLSYSVKGMCLVRGQIFKSKHMKINPNNGRILKRVGK